MALQAAPERRSSSCALQQLPPAGGSTPAGVFVSVLLAQFILPLLPPRGSSRPRNRTRSPALWAAGVEPPAGGSCCRAQELDRRSGAAWSGSMGPQLRPHEGPRNLMHFLSSQEDPLVSPPCGSSHVLPSTSLVSGIFAKVERPGPQSSLYKTTSIHPLAVLPGVTGTTWSLGPSWPDLGLSSHTHLAPAAFPAPSTRPFPPKAELGPCIYFHSEHS